MASTRGSTGTSASASLGFSQISGPDFEGDSTSAASGRRGPLEAGPPRDGVGPAFFVAGLFYGHCYARLCPPAPLYFAAFLVITCQPSITAGRNCPCRRTLKAHLLCGTVPFRYCPPLRSLPPSFPPVLVSLFLPCPRPFLPRWEWVLYVFQAFLCVLPLWSRSGLDARVKWTSSMCFALIE